MLTPAQIDEIEAVKAIHAMRNNNTAAFNQVIDDAFARPGGIERMIRTLATQLAKEQQ